MCAMPRLPASVNTPFCIRTGDAANSFENKSQSAVTRGLSAHLLIVCIFRHIFAMFSDFPYLREINMENGWIMKLDHFAMYVKDLEAAKTFFTQYFGASSNEMYHNPKTGLRTYFLSFLYNFLHSFHLTIYGIDMAVVSSLLFCWVSVNGFTVFGKCTGNMFHFLQ